MNRSQIGHQLHESSAKCDSPFQITKAPASVLTVPAAASHAMSGWPLQKILSAALVLRLCNYLVAGMQLPAS